jgi:6,7-dimethyl-8-ribityllumazine synthase
MATEIEGNLILNGESIAIVVARFNDLITKRLLDGAMNTLVRHGGSDENITVVHVPGSFEIPLIADRLAKSGKFAAVICLGAVIQGQTTHHDYINHQVAAGLREASQQSGIPVTFGVLTCQTMEQAIDRAGGKVGNKGNEAALAAIEMISTLKILDEEGITDATVS